MSYSMEWLGSEIQQPITFSNVSNITADYVIAQMENVCSQQNIPVRFKKDTITSGSFFTKKTYECVVVIHPNPPQEYAEQIYVLAGNTILFHFFGRSKAFKENSEYEATLEGRGTTVQSMKYMFKRPDKVALEIELGWHRQVIGAFNSLVRS